MRAQEETTKLQSEILELKSQLEAFKLTSENANAIKGYQEILKQLTDLPSELKSNVQKALIVRHANLKSRLSNKLTETELEHFDTTTKSLKLFIKHWEAEDYNARQGDFLENLGIAVKSLTNNMKETNWGLWANWTDELRASFAVEEYLLDAQQGLDAVEERRKEFKSKRDIFEEKSKSIPDDIAAIEEIRGLVEFLKGLMSQMNHEIPEEVKQFFASMSGFGGGAPISLLTPSVIEYLRANKALDNFVVQRPGSRRGY